MDNRAELLKALEYIHEELKEALSTKDFKAWPLSYIEMEKSCIFSIFISESCIKPVKVQGSIIKSANKDETSFIFVVNNDNVSVYTQDVDIISKDKYLAAMYVKLLTDFTEPVPVVSYIPKNDDELYSSATKEAAFEFKFTEETEPKRKEFKTEEEYQEAWYFFHKNFDEERKELEEKINDLYEDKICEEFKKEYPIGIGYLYQGFKYFLDINNQVEKDHFFKIINPDTDTGTDTEFFKEFISHMWREGKRYYWRYKKEAFEQQIFFMAKAYGKNKIFNIETTNYSPPDKLSYFIRN